MCTRIATRFARHPFAQRLAVALIALAAHAGPAAGAAAGPPQEGVSAPAAMLVFTRTEGYRHASIPDAVETLRALAAADGITVDHSEDPASFSTTTLAKYRVVVFANTTGPLLDGEQRAAFEQWVRNGGGFIGLETAAVAVKTGMKVTVLEGLPRVLARVTVPEVSTFFERVHREVLQNYLDDNLNAWELDASGAYHKRGPAPGERPHSAQQALLDGL